MWKNPKPKKCLRCGKEFIPKTWTQKYCLNPCVAKIQNFKNRCEVCGRHIRSRIPINSDEKLLCGFCYSRERAEAQAYREMQSRKVCTNPRKCKNCGEYAFLVRYTHLCRTCYTKLKNPTVLDVKEVSE